MALFNPFRENISIPQKPVTPARTNDTFKCAPPNTTEGGFRGRGTGRFSRGFPRGGSPAFRGRGGGGGRGGSRGRNGRGSDGWRQNRAETPLEPDEVSVEFQCEACERVFFNKEDLREHLNLHVSCPHCKYAALQQLVDLHIKLVHDKHLASKVMEQSPEEIAEYLAERRRKFPRKKVGSDVEPQDQPSTIANSTRETKGVIHEGNVRGNRRGKFGHTIIKDREDKINETEGICSQGQRPRKRKRRRGRQSRGGRSDQPVVPVEDEGPQLLEGVPRFKGLAQANKAGTKSAPKSTDDEAMVAGHDNISDVDDYTPAPLPQLPLAASKALASLMACYSDSDDEETPKPPAAKVTKHEDLSAPQKDTNQVGTRPCNNKKPCSENCEDRQQPEPLSASGVHLMSETITKSSIVNAGSAASMKRSPTDSLADVEIKAVLRSIVEKVALAESHAPSRVPQRRAPPVVQMSQRKRSLLEKLLAKDIRHERNILLQCVDFVVQKNFFDGMNFDV